MLDVVAIFQAYAASFLDRLRNDREGASLIEYTVLIGIIAVGVIALINSVGGTVITRWTTLESILS